MSVEIKGNVTVIIDKESREEEPRVLIWTIGDEGLKTIDIDGALVKAFGDQYCHTKNVADDKRITPEHHMGD